MRLLWQPPCDWPRSWKRPPQVDVSFLPLGAVSLAAMAVVHAGLPISADGLGLDVLVARTT